MLKILSARLCFVLLLTMLPKMDAAAVEGELIEASMIARVDEAGKNLTVSITYKIRRQPNQQAFTFRGVPFFETHFDSIAITLDALPLPASIEQDASGIYGQFHLPATHGADSLFTVEISYEVSTSPPAKSDRFDIAVPLIWITHEQADTSEDVFFAQLHLPEGYHVTESFPMRIAQNEAGARYQLSLQVLPAFVRVRGQVGAASRWTAIVFTDLFLISLVLFCFVGGVRWITQNNMKR